MFRLGAVAKSPNVLLKPVRGELKTKRQKGQPLSDAEKKVCKIPKLVIQRHHIVYERKDKKQEDVIVTLRKEEHFFITKINQFRHVTKGFLRALKYFIFIHEEDAIDLEAIRQERLK